MAEAELNMIACLLFLVTSPDVRGLNISPTFAGIEPVRAMMVRAGDSVTMACDEAPGESEEWFFCLWRHPSGGKECSVQEAGTRRRVCDLNTGVQGAVMEVSSASSRECDLSLRGLGPGDAGYYMCMLTRAETYHTRQTWTLIEVGEQDRVMLDSATHNITDALTLAAVEGGQVELECTGEPGAVPRPGYRWSVAGAGGEELSILSRPGQPGLNFTAEIEANGTRITCTSEQRNTYTQELMYSSTVTVMILVSPAPAQFLSLTQAQGSLITLTFLSVLILLLALSIVMVLVIRKRKSPPPSSGSSEYSGPPEAPYLSPIWTHQDSSSSKRSSVRKHDANRSSSVRNLDLRRISVLNMTEKTLPKYIHPLNPSLMMTSTPVRKETDTSSFHFNVSGCLDSSGEHNHSIGDIVDGNFVSFSSSDMYCLNLTEMAERSLEAKDVEDAVVSVLESIPEKKEVEKEDLSSLCDQCRTSICSRASSTSTLTGMEVECSQSSSDASKRTESTTSLNTLNIEDISSCDSVITIESVEVVRDEENDEEEPKFSESFESVIDTASEKFEEES